MGDSTVPSDPVAAHHDHRMELAKESATMALYVAICLLAALTVASRSELGHEATVVKLVWGTTLGLTLAHWFAFRLSARLVAAGTVRRSDGELAVAQFVGGVVVAAIVTVPVLVWDGDAELDAARWTAAAFISLVAYFVARNSGASVLRSAAYASTTTVIALTVVVLKNTLSGH